MAQTKAAELRAHLSRIAQELNALQSQMMSLHAERATVASQLGAIVYPILSLPNELVSEIFSLYVKDHPKRSPMCLTWVCKLWRDIAISTCSLWTSFRSHSGVLFHLIAFPPY
ncbi:hypothetical protein FB45DRAFT_759275 [Roridomyces roridus]|uniref:F-box domain-containing protein n=1 Tax=Roridomyces roridus TaxID=1738132 RepID=A0AAD7B7R7_9AGAR|nr:hypothetical protein FB45DRAFT_759275 [Roridomyces roridus]